MRSRIIATSREIWNTCGVSQSIGRSYGSVKHDGGLVDPDGEMQVLLEGRAL